jgi:HK97 family phage major capsid protein
MKKRLKEIQRRTSEIMNMTAEQLTDEIREERDGLLVEARQLTIDIAAQDEMRKLETQLNKPVETDAGEEVRQVALGEKTTVPESEFRFEKETKVYAVTEQERKPVYRNLAQNMKDIMDNANPNAGTDVRQKAYNRLVATHRAATGMSAKVDADVGFAIQTDFAGMMLDSAVKASPFLSMIDSYTVSESADRVKWIDLDEASVATTVCGGVMVYWRGENQTVTATQPKMKERNMELNTLMGLAYATHETLKHASFTSQWLENCFQTAIAYKLEGDIIADGTGVGRPQSILASPATITQAIEAGQTSDTPFMYKNITGMWTRLLPEERASAIWLAHPDAEEQFEYITFPVGTGGVPVFQTAGGGIGAGVSTLKQRPIVPSMHCSALNSKGDLILCNPKGYMLVRKGGVESETSIHVRFVYGEQAFRWLMYANGMVKRSQPLTIKNSSLTRSSFVTLAART